MLVISSREFRDKQAEYMDRADKGEQIIVQRGRDKAYAITPVKSSDIYINTQVLSEDFVTGEQIKERVHQHIDKLFSK
ncbi:type II toxin-antitoxin system prevent-host-death family antitoxin [Dysgonomonas sp. 521]|uniref:type II toxin-antitoxin system prevent-host-death family antitoxin n=1 Tax=Dysgonomonas sp. 521 TaxID=2302932 RepID=UPI0013D84E43|nr:type II toxin-antitoxin system prevent-host-death family antitoxin [Dysgonomonas sp. 521]NDV97190.1 type II toxin-antitoxin system prevent-host-death family antitoxin [Dysgonomonas sp. 521]